MQNKYMAAHGQVRTQMKVPSMLINQKLWAVDMTMVEACQNEYKKPLAVPEMSIDPDSLNKVSLALHGIVALDIVAT